MCPICYLKLDLPGYFQTLDDPYEERHNQITHVKTAGYLVSSFDFGLVPPARFEHAAYGLGNRRSIRLSYGGTRRLVEIGPAPVNRPEIATSVDRVGRHDREGQRRDRNAFVS